ncbi:dTMP kinase [bacterium]|nr:dTMP kinase [bacterium]
MDVSLKGLFIVIEGGEGAGKSTQAELLYRSLSQRFPAVLTREPGGTSLGERIRQLLLDPALRPINPRAELFLFLAARAQHIEEVIKPALMEGKIVISDRFSLSSLAYQGFGRGLDLPLLEEMDAFARQGISPHLTIYIDIPPEEGMKRLSTLTPFEGEPMEFHKRVREGYLELASRYPEEIKVVDGRGGVEEVQERIEEIVKELIRRWCDEASNNGCS